VADTNGHSNGNGKQRNNRRIGYCSPPEGRPFPKGKSGNLNGRPKGESLTTKLRRVLDEPDTDHGTKADKLIAAAVEAAGNGDVRYFKEILDRIDGKVPDRVANMPGESLVVKVIKGVSMDDL
jgi:hypothetical protein